jgi:hypothetical protein
MLQDNRAWRRGKVAVSVFSICQRGNLQAAISTSRSVSDNLTPEGRVMYQVSPLAARESCPLAAFPR